MIGEIVNGRFRGTSCVHPRDIIAKSNPDGSWSTRPLDGTWPTGSFASTGEVTLSCTEIWTGRGLWSVLWRDHTRRVNIFDGGGATITLTPASVNALLDAADTLWPGLYPPESRLFDAAGGGVIRRFQWDGAVNDASVAASIAIIVANLTALIRRRRRYAPGHCQACGYSLAGLHGFRCPECGHDSPTPQAG